MIPETISTVRSRLIVGLIIFLLAFSVRVLTWHDTRLEVGKIQSAVVADYQRVAQLLHDGGVSSFFSRSSPLADLNNLGHPPGYSVLLAVIYSVRQSEALVQFVQMGADAFSAVLIFLIVAELLSVSAAVVSGVLAVLSPQLAWNSVLLLPDSISVLPILLAVFLLARAWKRPRLLSFAIIGALLGISCWLRANAMFMTLFFAATAALLMPSRKRWQFAAAVMCGALLVILPLTIRNAIVCRRFIPLSLGAGQTLLEGISDYDREGRFGIPNTDVGIMKQEAELYQRPDYYGTLFSPHGVERERARLTRGFAVIRAHPIWFAGVMAKRASSMVRLERSRLISTAPSITHSLSATASPFQVLYPTTMAQNILSPSTQIRIEEEAGHAAVLTIIGNESRYGEQAAWSLSVQPDTDCFLETAVKVEMGRIRISVVDPQRRVLASTVIDAGSAAPNDYTPVRMGFVAPSPNLQLVVSNEASDVPHSLSKFGPIGLYELGPARFKWTRYPRMMVHALQKIFLTAVMLPLATIGLLILILRKKTAALVVLSLVPIYFFTVQSAIHTEYRYVIAVTYFVFAFAGIAVGCGVDFGFRKLQLLIRSSSSATRSVPSA